MHWIDPDYLPVVTGTLERFILRTDGRIDGFVLVSEAGDRLVHVPPHLDAAVRASLSPGQTVEVRGVQPRGAAVLAAVALRPLSGEWIVDEGPEDHGPGEKPPRKPAGHRHAGSEDRQAGEATMACGRVRLSLFAPRGELRGALLDDGTLVRGPADKAGAFAEWLRPGAMLAAEGIAAARGDGVTLDARRLGPDPDNLARL